MEQLTETIKDLNQNELKKIKKLINKRLDLYNSDPKFFKLIPKIFRKRIFKITSNSKEKLICSKTRLHKCTIIFENKNLLIFQLLNKEINIFYTNNNLFTSYSQKEDVIDFGEMGIVVKIYNNFLTILKDLNLNFSNYNKEMLGILIYNIVNSIYSDFNICSNSLINDDQIEEYNSFEKFKTEIDSIVVFKFIN